MFSRKDQYTIELLREAAAISRGALPLVGVGLPVLLKIESYDRSLQQHAAVSNWVCCHLLLCAWLARLDPTRVYEYLFLVASMLLSVVYGIVHDHITATISADYFLKAKGLELNPQPFRWAVTWLAIKATYGPGVLAGALMLIANNPSSKTGMEDDKEDGKEASATKPQLPYPHMLRLCVYPVVVAAICALLGGVIVPTMVYLPQLRWVGCRWFADAALAYTTPDRVTPFLVVWGVHAGSYLGATLGTVIAVVKVAHARKKSCL